MSPLLNPSSSQLKSLGATALGIAWPALLKTLPLNTGLTSFSPTRRYPSLDLYRYVYLIRAVQNGIHPFDHRLLQPVLHVHRLLCITLGPQCLVAEPHDALGRKRTLRVLGKHAVEASSRETTEEKGDSLLAGSGKRDRLWPERWSTTRKRSTRWCWRSSTLERSGTGR